MDFFWEKCRRRFSNIFVSYEKEEKKRQLTRLEGYFGIIYKVLSWNDAALTLTCFSILNVLFWFVVQLELRFFGAVCFLALAMFVADSYLENYNFSVQPSELHVLDEIKNDINDLILTVKAMRKDSPSSFCIGMTVVFLMFSFVARSISGHALIYFLLLAMFFGPLALSKVPPKYFETLRNFIKNLSSERGVLAEDELIPYIFDKDFNQRDPDQDSLLTDRTTDSVTNSLILGLNAMPSHLDNDDKESLEEDDLIPLKTGGVLLTPGEISSDTDSDSKGIEFTSGHFNGDSSSDEENYAKNLNFSNQDTKQLPSQSSVLGPYVPGFIKTIFSSAKNDSSGSDSEFEIINNESLQ